MDNLSVTTRYRLTATDYIRVLVWYQWKRIAVVNGLVSFLMLLLAFAVVNPTALEPNKRLPLFLAAVLVPIFVFPLTYLGLRKQARKLEAISEETELSIGPIEIETVTASSSGKMRWERLKKVVEIGRYFVIFPQDNVYFVLPKESFTGSDSLEAFRTILRRELGGQAKLKE